MGYYVNVEYDDEETKENPPDKPIVAKCAPARVTRSSRALQLQSFSSRATLPGSWGALAAVCLDQSRTQKCHRLLLH